jgi:hypothetical protein
MKFKFKLIAFCSILLFAVVGCNKQSNDIVENQPMSTPIISNLIPDLLTTTNGYTATANNQSLLFHYANAIQQMTSNTNALSLMASALVASEGINPVFVNTLATSNASFRSLLNTALRTSVTNYPNLPSSGINWNDLLQNPALDAHQWMMTQLVALGAEEPIIYSLDEISAFDFSKPRVIMDIEIAGGTNSAGWQNGVQQTFTEVDGLANVDRTVAVTLSVKQKNTDDRDGFSDVRDQKLKKYYHHGKVDWLSSSNTNSDVKVEWKTKATWHSYFSWNLAQGDLLNQSNPLSSFSYTGFQIHVRVRSNWLNYNAYQRHWDYDLWQLMTL